MVDTYDLLGGLNLDGSPRIDVLRTADEQEQRARLPDLMQRWSRMDDGERAQCNWDSVATWLLNEGAYEIKRLASK